MIRNMSTRLTTPDALTINKHLALMNEAGVEYCFMEVSSHGIAQRRSEGLFLKGRFLPTSPMTIWITIKPLPNTAIQRKNCSTICLNRPLPWSNADDKNGLFMMQNTKARKYTYALKSYTVISGRRSWSSSWTGSC